MFARWSHHVRAFVWDFWRFPKFPMKFHPRFVSGWRWRFPSNVEFFKLYPRGRKARIWGIIGAFRFVKLQSTAEVFLAPNHTAGVHNASVMRPQVTHKTIKFKWDGQKCPYSNPLADYDVLLGTLPRFPKHVFTHRINLAWIVMTCWTPPPQHLLL